MTPIKKLSTLGLPVGAHLLSAKWHFSRIIDALENKRSGGYGWECISNGDGWQGLHEELAIISRCLRAVRGAAEAFLESQSIGGGSPERVNYLCDTISINIWVERRVPRVNNQSWNYAKFTQLWMNQTTGRKEGKRYLRIAICVAQAGNLNGFLL